MFKERTIGLKSFCSFLFWLIFLVFGMMIVGAFTRLSDSGLSMVEWRLLWGFLPPMDTEEWSRVFNLYQGTEQYAAINFGMTLEEFKGIFWWEYAHRVLGRLIGVFFVLGFFYLAFRRKLNARSIPHLLLIFLLGAGQAFLGWWMVNGGLEFRTAVEPYRLMLHLGLAFLIFGYLVWLWRLNLCELNRKYNKPASAKLHYAYFLILLLCFGVILLGALVAGLKAGLIYNEWPLMGGQFFPADYFMPSAEFTGAEFINNAILNPVAAQFHHRTAALLVLPALIAYRLYLFRFPDNKSLYASANMMVLLALVQTSLGIVTLVMQVPVLLGVAHQGVAALLFATVVWHWRDVRGFI